MDSKERAYHERFMREAIAMVSYSTCLIPRSATVSLTHHTYRLSWL
jgi:hypothetical protein